MVRFSLRGLSFGVCEKKGGVDEFVCFWTAPIGKGKNVERSVKPLIAGILSTEGSAEWVRANNFFSAVVSTDDCGYVTTTT